MNTGQLWNTAGLLTQLRKMTVNNKGNTTMAKLSAHGNVIGTINFTSTAKRYMADGVVLKNYGMGWKLAGKVKAGITPEQAYKNAAVHQVEYMATRPAFAAYRRELHSMAGLCRRWKLHTAIQLMPDDCDGVWSECCNGYGDNVSASVDEVAALCRLYIAACDEQKAIKAELMTA